MALHEQSLGKTDEWYTPPHVFTALDCRFSADVASPGEAVTPWIPANQFITEGSLAKEWTGFVWMNAPFGGRNGLMPWLEKFFYHGNGIALVPDRTSAPWWRAYAPKSDLILFVSPKLKFLDATGAPGESPAQGTSLFAVGTFGRSALINASRGNLGTLVKPAMGFSHD